MTSIKFYWLFRKNPLNIINGTKRGPDKASATLTDGETAEIKDPLHNINMISNIIFDFFPISFTE